MKKKLIFFMVCCLALGACKDDENSMVHYYTLAVSDMSWGRADMSYINAYFPEESRVFTKEGTRNEADHLALVYYNNIIRLIDDDSVCGQFASEFDATVGEFLYYEVDLLRSEGTTDTLARKRWSHNGTNAL